MFLTGFVFIYFLLSGDASGRSLATLYIFYGGFCGGGVGLSYNTLLGVATRHYPGRGGMATGILLLGFGAGALLLGGFVTYLIAKIGINYTFLVLGCLLAAILFIGSFFIHLPSVDSAGEINIEKTKNKMLSEAVAKPSFWILCIWNICMCIGGLIVLNSAVPIAVRFGMLAVLGLIISVFNGIGRLFIGILMDNIGRRKAMLFNSFIMVIGGVLMMMGSLTELQLFIYLGFPFVGLGYGGTPTLLSAVVNKFYGPKNFQNILAVATFSLGIAAIIGPIMSSKLQELSGGEYMSSFVVIIIVAILAVCLCVLLNAFSRREGLE